MKKIEKTSEWMWVFGTVFVALGVAICSKVGLGVSMIAAPAFVLSEALQPLWERLSVGVMEYVFQGVLLVLMCLLVRKFNWRYLLAFAAAVLYGYTLNFLLFLLNGVQFEAVWLRWLMLLVGDCLTAFGVACFFKTYLPLQVYELFVAECAAHFHLHLTRVKGIFDSSLLAISLVLALTLFGDLSSLSFSLLLSGNFHSIGLGTVVTTLINSPIIAFFGSLLDRFFSPSPAFPKVEKVLKR